MMKRIMCAIAALLLLVPLAGCGGKTDQESLEDAIYLLALDMCDKPLTYQQFLQLKPEEIWEDLEEDWDMTLEEIYEDFKEAQEESHARLEETYGKNFKVSCEINRKTSLNKAEFEAIQNYLSEKYGIRKSDITEACQVTFTCYLSGSKYIGHEKYSCDVVKIRGTYYEYER